MSTKISRQSLILFLGLATQNVYSQNVGINTDGSSPESGTMLDIKSAGSTSSNFGLKVKNSIGTSQFAVRSDGNVGVGTTTPEGKLEIKNTAGTLSSPHISIEGTGGQTDDFALWHPSGLNKLQFGYENGTNTGTILTLDAGTGSSLLGNVGIGTTTPLSLLHVSSGTSGNSVITVEADTDNNNEEDNPLIKFRQDGGLIQGMVGINGDVNLDPEGNAYEGSLTNTLFLGMSTTGSGGKNIQFGTEGSVKMTILNGGNVGIGTNSPSDALHVLGAPNGSGIATAKRVLLLQDSTASAEGVGGGIYFGGKYNSSGDYTSWSAIWGEKANGTSGNTAGKLFLGARTSGLAIRTDMTIDDTGNVGITRTSPNAKLHINHEGPYPIDTGGDMLGELTEPTYKQLVGNTPTAWQTILTVPFNNYGGAAIEAFVRTGGSDGENKYGTYYRKWIIKKIYNGDLVITSVDAGDASEGAIATSIQGISNGSGTFIIQVKEGTAGPGSFWASSVFRIMGRGLGTVTY